MRERKNRVGQVRRASKLLVTFLDDNQEVKTMDGCVNGWVVVEERLLKQKREKRLREEDT